MTDTPVKVKLCGMFRKEDIDAVNQLRPDYCGFIINFPKSHRNLSIDQVKKLKDRLDDGIKSVGVFVDEDPKIIESLLNDNTIDIAQLHGNEDNDTIVHIKDSTSKPVIRAFCPGRMSSSNISIEEIFLKIQSSKADYVLLDNGQGTGSVTDWDMISKALDNGLLHRDFFLAGGLDSNNILSSISKLHPYAVDVSSGIETNGLKDPFKMRRFIDVLKGAKGI